MVAVKYARRKGRADYRGGRAEDPEGQERVTLLLGTDTIEKLTTMAETGRYRGLGRTIDALVDAVDDSRTNVEALVRAGLAANMLPQVNPPNVETLRAQLGVAFALNSAVLAERLNKFVGIRPESLVKEIQRDLQTLIGPRSGLTTPPPGDPSSATGPGGRP